MERDSGTNGVTPITAAPSANGNRVLLTSLEQLRNHKPAQLQFKREYIKRIDADMIFREMPSVARGALEERHFVDDGEGNSVMKNRQEWRAACVALCWVDSEDPATAERVCSGDEAVAEINLLLPSAAMDEAYEVISKINKLRKIDQEAEKGNSAGGDGIVRSRLSPSTVSTVSPKNISSEPPVTAEPVSSSAT